MNTIPIIMFNEQNRADYKEYVKILEDIKSDTIILRSSVSGVPMYRSNDLHLDMKYPILEQMFDKNKSTRFFTTTSDMIQNLRMTESEELIEMPMGYLISEKVEMIAPSAMSEYNKGSEIVTSHKIDEQRKVNVRETRNYHHAMSITHLHQFLMNTGAIPIDQSTNWSGNDRVQNRKIVTNMMFRTYYKFKQMPREEAIEYIKSLITGCPIIPKNMKVSELYHSIVTIYQIRPLYVPFRSRMRNRLFTYPNSGHRLVYLYDCISNWVMRANSTYYKVVTELVDGYPTGNYTYSIEDLVGAFSDIKEDSASGILRPNFLTLSTFAKFRILLTITPSEKKRAIVEFFKLLGHNIDVQQLLSEDSVENEDYVSRESLVDPLTDYRDYWVVQKSRRQEHGDNSERIAAPQRRPKFDGYREFESEKEASQFIPKPRSLSYATAARSDSPNEGQGRSHETSYRGRGRGHSSSTEMSYRGRGLSHRNHGHSGIMTWNDEDETRRYYTKHSNFERHYDSNRDGVMMRDRARQ